MSEDNGQEIDAEIVGQKFRARNYRMLDLLALAAFITFSTATWFLYQDFKEQVKTQNLASTVEHKRLGESVDALKGATEEQTYVLTLKQEDRERLKLEMPRSLREKVYNR